jgi:hypothetical protein
MATITTRAGKGSPLTNTEVDDNFSNLNSAKYESGATPTFGDVVINDVSPAILLQDTSVTNLEHKINSSSDNLRLTVDANNVDTGGRLEFFIGPSANQIRFGKSEVSFNEASMDVDFRVESNDNSHMLFVDASTNGVGIGDGTTLANGLRISSSTVTTDAVDTKLYINADSSGTTTTGFGPGITFAGVRNGDGVLQQMAQINAVAEVNSGTNLSSGIQFKTATVGVNTEKVRINYNGGFVVTPAANGHAVFNEGAVDADFRVESDSDTHALFVQGSDGYVGVGGTAAAKLQVSISDATEYSPTEASELSPVGTDALFLFNGENTSTNGKVSILMRNAGSGGSAAARITLKNERSGSGGLGFFFRDGSHTPEMQEKAYLDSDGNFSLTGTLSTNSDVTIAKSATGVPRLTLSGFAGANSPYGIINFYNEDGSQQGPNNAAQIKALAINTDGSGGSLDFHTSTGTGTGGADATKKLTIGGGGAFTTYPSAGQPTRFNEDGNDSDFRVESSGNANMLFVDGDANTVVIGGTTAETADTFEVISADATTNVRIRNTNAGATGPLLIFDKSSASPASDDDVGDIRFIGKDSGGNAEQYARLLVESANITAGAEDAYTTFNMMVNGTDTNMYTMNHVGTTFNEGGDSDLDFRVESVSNTHMLFVDGGNNSLTIGNTVVNPASGFSNQAGFGYSATGQVQIAATSNLATLVLGQNQATNGSMLDFRKQGAMVGSVSVTGAGTTYNTTSDRRLKDNIETITDGTDKLMAMNPVTHGWKADPEADTVHGFIAQEMMEIIPEAVSGDPEGEEMMSMDYGRITPVIVAALQDALKEIKELKTRINELENK